MRLQVVEFVFGELEHEAGRKSIYMPLHVPYEDAGLDTIKLGQVSIEHDLVTANQIYPLLNGFH